MKKPNFLNLISESKFIVDYIEFNQRIKEIGNPPRSKKPHSVLVIPGFLTDDHSTKNLRKFLTDIGHKTYPWELGINTGPQKAMEKLTEKVEEIFKQDKQKIDIVGWSLGGLMGYYLATKKEKEINSLITMGSPFSGDPDDTNLALLFEMISKFHDKEEIAKWLDDKPKVPVSSIYSKNDGLVNWEACLLNGLSVYENIEVESGHLSMPVDPKIMFILADRLSQNIGEFKKYSSEGVSSNQKHIFTKQV